MSFGKMNKLIEIVSSETVKDREGFSRNVETVLARVRGYKEERHGNEKWANRAIFSEAIASFCFRKIPHIDISTSMVIVCDGERYEIINVEDVRGRGMYVEVLVKKVVASSG